MSKRKSLYHACPDYRVELEPSSQRVRVHFAGELIADGTRTLSDRVEANAVRSHQDPFDEVLGSKGCLACYPDRVERQHGA